MYPSRPSEKLSWSWRHSWEIGEFRCYDKVAKWIRLHLDSRPLIYCSCALKNYFVNLLIYSNHVFYTLLCIDLVSSFTCQYMTVSLNACAQNVGMTEWGNADPLGADSLTHDPETSFFRSNDGTWNTPYGHFFLEWYARMLLQHGERLSMAAVAIFFGTGVKISAKVAGIHWHYSTSSHPFELTAGYYNTLPRDGYFPITRMLSRYNMTLCCTCFDMQDGDELKIDQSSSPEGFVRLVISTSRKSKIPLMGENSTKRCDDTSLEPFVKNSKLYIDGMPTKSLSSTL